VLPITETLHWTGEAKGFYFIYYLNPATSKYELWQHNAARLLAGSGTTMSYKVNPTFFAPSSAHNGESTAAPAANYFLIVHNIDGKTPTVANGSVTRDGSGSLHFSAPQLYFFSGSTDGDGVPFNPALPATPAADTAIGVAKFYDAKFGAQMTTFAWNEPYKWALPTVNTLNANLKKFPTHNFILMGQSFGGGAAVGIVNDLHAVGGAFPKVQLLQLFDPVASGPLRVSVGSPPYLGNIPLDDQNTSHFTLPTDWNGKGYTVQNWYSSDATEHLYESPYHTPTGTVIQGPGALYNRQLDAGIAPGTYSADVAGTLGLSHVSQVVYGPALNSFGTYVNPYLSPGGTYIPGATNGWAF
jgi:hypothetical protein